MNGRKIQDFLSVFRDDKTGILDLCAVLVSKLVVNHGEAVDIGKEKFIERFLRGFFNERKRFLRNDHAVFCADDCRRAVFRGTAFAVVLAAAHEDILFVIDIIADNGRGRRAKNLLFQTEIFRNLFGVAVCHACNDGIKVFFACTK